MCDACKAKVRAAKRALRGKRTRPCAPCRGTGEYARGRVCHACQGRGVQTLADIARCVAYWVHRAVPAPARAADATLRALTRPLTLWE